MSDRLLSDLVARLNSLHLLAEPATVETVITSAPTHDSRQVSRGGLFVAIPGRKVDGVTFIASATEHGAAAVLSEQHVDSSVPLVVVRDARAALAIAAAWWRVIQPKS